MIKPQWTDRYNVSQRGRDHLAYENVGVIMLDKLLAGISNITFRARYHSFFAWVLYRFFEHSQQKKTYRNFRQYLKRKSLVFLYANALNHLEDSRSGIDGIELVRKQTKNASGKIKNYNWNDDDIKKYHDNYWIYSAKMQQLGVTAENKEYALNSLVNPLGKNLAKLFEGSIKKTDYFTKYCDKDESAIPTQVLEEYGRSCGVLELNKFSEEQDFLSEIFFRFPKDSEEKDINRYYIDQDLDGSSFARTESFFLFLDIIDKIKGAKFNYEAFRKIVYFHNFGERIYKPIPELNDNLEFWRMFEARQYFVYALESIFAEITNILYKKKLTFTALLEKLFINEIFSEFSNKTGVDLSPSITLKKLIKSLRKGKTSEEFDKICGLDSALNEEFLYQEIDHKIYGPEYIQCLPYSLTLLIFLYLRFNYYRVKKPLYWKFAQIGGETSLSMDKFFHELEDSVSRNVTIEDFMVHVIKEFIIDQHRRVAIAKLSWYKNDTFHFYYDGDYFNGTRRSDPKMNAPKFVNTVNILYDLGMIESKDNAFFLTEKGKRSLREYETKF